MEFIELLKLQISNHKYQTIPNNLNSKSQTMSRFGGFWALNTRPVKFRLKADHRKRRI
jgi:hypothetical protein